MMVILFYFILYLYYRLREERVDERGHSMEQKPRDLSSHNGNFYLKLFNVVLYNIV